MAVAKTEDFSIRQNKVAGMFKAMGHPARVAIMEYLLRRESCVCGDIVDQLPLAQATVSQHLKALKDAGLIKGTVEGASVCYCINEKSLTYLKDYFEGLSRRLLKQNGNCC